MDKNQFEQRGLLERLNAFQSSRQKKKFLAQRANICILDFTGKRLKPTFYKKKAVYVLFN